MVDRFQLLRVSLVKREQALLFGEPELRDRETILREIFSTRWQFQHLGQVFYYVPQPLPDGSGWLFAHPNVSILAGLIGRKRRTEENLAPEQDFAPTEHELWKAAAVLLDPTPHADGQKLAMSHDRNVGRPTAVLGSFVLHINQQARLPYHLEIEPIFDAESFWTFAEQHKNTITSLDFEFATPNMWGGTDDLEEELRGLRDSERAQKVVVKLSSDVGLRTSTQRVREGVDYATKGGGRITAKTSTGKRYNSKDNIKKVVIETPPDAAREPLLVRVARSIHSILES